MLQFAKGPLFFIWPAGGPRACRLLSHWAGEYFPIDVELKFSSPFTVQFFTKGSLPSLFKDEFILSGSVGT